MKLKQDKCHSLRSGHKYERVWSNIGSCKIWESNDQKLPVLNIDRNLKFSHYILKLGKKAGRKLSALTRICKFMSLERRRVLMKSFIESQFAYCPLVWICCEKTFNNRINHLHKRARRTAYNDNVSTFEKLPEKDSFETTYVKSLRILAADLYKMKENLAVPIIHETLNRGISNMTFAHKLTFS